MTSEKSAHPVVAVSEDESSFRLILKDFLREVTLKVITGLEAFRIAVLFAVTVHLAGPLEVYVAVLVYVVTPGPRFALKLKIPLQLTVYPEMVA